MTTLLRRPLPPPQPGKNEKKKSSPTKNVKKLTHKNLQERENLASVLDNSLRDTADILNASVSDRFDLLQRQKQREAELNNFFKVRGPDGFPLREPRRPIENSILSFLGESNEEYPVPEFTLEDFKNNNKIQDKKNKTQIVSFHPWDYYDKKLLEPISNADKKFLEGKTIGNTEPLPDIATKNPWRLQKIIDDRFAIEEEYRIAEHGGDSQRYQTPGYATVDSAHELALIDDIIRSLPGDPTGDEEYLAESKLTWSQSMPQSRITGTKPHTRQGESHVSFHECGHTSGIHDYDLQQQEFIEDLYVKFSSDKMFPVKSVSVPVNDGHVLKMSVTLPVAMEEGEEGAKDLTARSSGDLTPADLAIMNCLAQGGTKLDLKAHFLAMIRPLNSLLIATLTHINLSFNLLETIPQQLFYATELKYVNLRNNPISEISDGIQMWRNIKSLNLAFCFISELPSSLFHLITMEVLDISYNHISVIPKEISKIRNLKELYCDGNNIGAFPRQMLSLSYMKVLRCANNYTNKLFWRGTASPQPQKLLYNCATAIKHANIDTSDLPADMRNMLAKHEKCDFCSSVMYGGGLPVVKPALQLFGIHLVPVLFHVCSLNCRKHLRKAEQLNCLLED